MVGSWRLVAAGGWRRLVAGGWWRLVVGGWWRLVVGGWWRLAVGGPLGLSLRAVLSKKKKKKSRSLRTPLACTEFKKKGRLVKDSRWTPGQKSVLSGTGSGGSYQKFTRGDFYWTK